MATEDLLNFLDAKRSGLQLNMNKFREAMVFSEKIFRPSPF
jgi:hypothetical protein